MDFMHQQQLKATGAEISFAAPLVIDAALPEGEVTVSDIYRLCPYENTLYALHLTGREVKDYLELSYDKWIAQKNEPLAYQNFDSAAGIIYEVDTTKPMGQRVRIKRMADGAPFRMDERYMIVVNSYRAHGGGGLMTEGAGINHDELLHRIVYSTTTDLRFYMISHVEMQKTVTPIALNHWRFVP
jgi:2',3'-cyclic-nucleotide 2'-phosphodiesterase/3'-nucleotidase